MDVWTCKIGRIDNIKIPDGADLPMREAVAEAYKKLTGRDASFIFSGWGSKLTEGELEVVADQAAPDV